MDKIYSKMAVLLVSVILMSQFAVTGVFADDISVSKSMPSRVDPEGTLTTTYTITPTGTVTGFDMAELMPVDWEISSWDISGYSKDDIETSIQDSQEFMGSTYDGYHWEFTDDLTSAVTLTYTINVPVSSGNYDFVSIYTYPGGFEKDENTLSVAEEVVEPTTPAEEVEEELTGVGFVQMIKDNWMIVLLIILVVVGIVYYYLKGFEI